MRTVIWGSADSTPDGMAPDHIKGVTVLFGSPEQVGKTSATSWRLNVRPRSASNQV
jgi:hypothetical protein